MKYTDYRSLLSDAKFYESYSRYDEKRGRYETWEEAVSRVMLMHREYYKDALQKSPQLAVLIDEAEFAYKKKLVLGAQRALQFGGEQLLKNHAKMYNCFERSTRFLTSEGMKSFLDYDDGDQILVYTHAKRWQSAQVKQYGQQQLNKITFMRRGLTKEVLSTSNHTWILSDGTRTSSLRVGHKTLPLRDLRFSEFDWDAATPEEKLYWCYGYVFGDGSITNNGYSIVRLCGRDIKFLYRFEEMGFKSSTSLSLKGDVFVYTGKYQKTLPIADDGEKLIRSFSRGFLDADGEKTTNAGNGFRSIQQSLNSKYGAAANKFIRDMFPLGGIWPTNTTHMIGQTNLGALNAIKTTLQNSLVSNDSWEVVSIEPAYVADVWCLEVDIDHSFVLEGGIVTGNCTSSYADRPEFFGEMFWLLLCGCGVGFSVQRQHVSKLPKIMPRVKQAKTHVVEDSIEGWATALDVLLSSFFENGGKFPEFKQRKVYFDLSQIRPKGAKISGGFKAPGPEPLRRSLDRIEYLLTGLVIQEKVAELRPIQVYDIVMHASDAVLSGGVRRSATICLFSADDVEMTQSKTGNWYNDNPQRARSNNSAVIIRDQITREQFANLMKSIKEFGEPGFFFVDDPDISTNPCVEIGMYPQINGQTGWQGCNLTEINGGACTTEQTFNIACRASAILGTLQAGYTKFDFLTDTSKKIFEREALLGTSITGWMDNPGILFNNEILERGAGIIKQVNREVAELININPAARTCCVKPSGSASVLLGTASGIHAQHSSMYLRHMQMNKDTEVAKLLNRLIPNMMEESVWSAGKTDFVAAFPIIPSTGSLLKPDLYGVKHLELVKKAQQHWVEAGTNLDLCANKAARHNVSNTIIVDNWDEVEEYVYNNRSYFAGISFLAMSGDKDFNQAPNTEVLTAEQLVEKYGVGAVMASGLVVEGLRVFNNDLWTATSTAQGYGLNIEGDNHENNLKREWIRRFDKFASNYFNGDKKKTEYCLKDVYLLHKWEKIQQSVVDVDWKKYLTEVQYVDVDTLGAIACAGPGGCEI